MAIGRAIARAKRRMFEPPVVQLVEPPLHLGGSVAPPTGGIAFTGRIPSAIPLGPSIPATAALGLLGAAPFRVESGSLLATPATGSLRFGRDRYLTPLVAALLATGRVPTITTTAGVTVTAPVGALALGGRTPSIPGGLDPLEGFGANATGGLGQPVYHVTHRGDSGAGSLRDAVSQSNRYVVFDVSGEINLPDQSIFLENVSNITIDGLSSLSGITITGNGISLFDSSNIIIRDLRLRRPTRERDYIGVIGPGCFDIVVDHCSMIGEPYTVLPAGIELGDGGFDVKSGAHDVTCQWCLIGVAKMSLIGSTSSDPEPNTRRVTIHHCAYIAPYDVNGTFGPVGDGYSDRHPLVRRGGTATEVTCDFYENIVANWWRAQGSKCDADAWANFRRSAYIPAPAVTTAEREQSVKFVAGTNTRCHVSGNVELGSPALAHDINTNGNEGSPLSAVAVTSRPLIDVFNKVGPRFPRDADETFRLGLIEDYAPFT